MASDGRRRISLGDFRHEALSETSSTNSECLARARAGDSGNLWVTAERQTGGRGRRGRLWVSEPGNLYASLLLIDPAPMERLGSLPLAVAVAVHQAISRVLPPGAEPLEVKWPNDILIGRKKTCGILVEGEGMPDGRYALIVGIGVNVSVMPDNPLYPATCLRQQGEQPRQRNSSRISLPQWPMCSTYGIRAAVSARSPRGGARSLAASAKRSPSIYRTARFPDNSPGLMIMAC